MSEKCDQQKRINFEKGRATSEKFEAIIITTTEDNQNVSTAMLEDKELQIIYETQLSQNDEGEYMHGSNTTNKCLYHDQGSPCEKSIKINAVSQNI